MGTFLVAGGHEALPDTVAEEPSVQEVVGWGLFALRYDPHWRAVLIEEGCLWVVCTVANHPSVASRLMCATFLADLAEADPE